MFWKKNKTAKRLEVIEDTQQSIESNIERIDRVLNAIVTILKKQNLIPKEYEDLDSENTTVIEDEIFNAERVVNEYQKEMCEKREELEMKRSKRGDDRKYVA